jgi:hypothetical protein
MIAERNIVCFIAMRRANAVGAQMPAAMTTAQIVSPQDPSLTLCV